MEQCNLKNILLCDDKALNRKLIVAMLKELPYRIIEATNGREALEYYLSGNEPLDLVLLDISMKDLNGVDVCQAMRRTDRDHKKRLPIIAYTAHAMLSERQMYLTAGFDDILTKPTLKEDLLKLLYKYITL